MKKILLLMAIMLPFTFYSWGKDNNEQATHKEHEYVDLGLPCGTLWATCNVGANSPEEYGDYFAWGETTPKDSYIASNYKFGDYYQLAKYCIHDLFGYKGFTDGKTELNPEDDAAFVNWGASWRMPTTEQLQELIDNCKWERTTQNGVNGQLGTGPNGNVIFFRLRGYREKEHFCMGGFGYYWSRTLNSERSIRANNLIISSNSCGCISQERYLGLLVRAVRAVSE